MSITEELRKEARGSGHFFHAREQAERLIAIADRIDAEYERVRAESIIDMTDESMAEHGWVRLPKDADGVPIRVGDVLEWSDGTTFEVVGIGDETLFYVDENDKCQWTSVKYKRHHRAPTVEDVLREFADKVCTGDHIVRNGVFRGLEDVDLLAEYASRLRLADDSGCEE